MNICEDNKRLTQITVLSCPFGNISFFAIFNTASFGIKHARIVQSKL